MLRRLRTLRRDERGMSFVFVGVGMMAFLSASTLAIDVGMLMVARSQAQNSADAGALAGAVALVFNDFDDRSPGGPAVQTAVVTAQANDVVGSPVSVAPSDVSFPTQDRVKVDVFRTAGRSNPVAMFIASIVGLDNVDVTASATAEAAPANAARCVLPFTISDKWLEMQTPPWDTADTFEPFPPNPSQQPDVYLPPTHPGYASTGYNPWTDIGMQVVIKAGTGNNIEPSFYYPWAIPGSNGAADYQWNIENCNMTLVDIGEFMTAEPGHMVGPTRQGIQALLDKDPGAYWDTLNDRVVSGMHSSPRVALIPVFDPMFYATGKQQGRNADLEVANFIGVFVEGLQGNDVIARVMPALGLIDGSAGPAPAGAFPRAIRLVE